MKTVKLNYPWFSLLLAVIAACGLFILANPSFLLFYKAPDSVFNSHYQAAALIFILLVILWDIRRFHRQRKVYDQTLEDLFKAKKKLQNKAHAYAGHSDKLKLFISDRLLEYIQYDEKFLHFKNIAGEVRHNGIIFFDKVQTALSGIISDIENDHSSVNAQHQKNCQDALDSMRYLWDLLDLSTTDNIALHIGNHLCECEEQYFQSILSKQQTPYQVTYKAHEVIHSYLLNLVEKPEKFTLTSDSNIERKSENKSERKNENKPIRYSDNIFQISLDTHSEILGNKNHLRLLIENLVANAQFYMKRNGDNRQLPAITIDLVDQDDAIGLSVYNRGNHIKEEDRDKIFQLGFSTRRKKDNHGKGLGLYFANQIIHGYEGAISFTNVTNKTDTYSLRLVLDDDSIHSNIVETTLSDNRPKIIDADNTQHKNIEWKYSSAIKLVEIFSNHDKKTLSFSDFQQGSNTIFDPHNAIIPSWSITIKQKKTGASLCFSPLDITGVMFNVSLPTAKARLNYSDDSIEAIEEDSFDNIISLENEYKGTGLG